MGVVYKAEGKRPWWRGLKMRQHLSNMIRDFRLVLPPACDDGHSLAGVGCGNREKSPPLNGH